MKANWGLEISRLLLFWKDSLSLARLSRTLQETLWKKTRLSESNSVVTLRDGRLGNERAGGGGGGVGAVGGAEG